MSLNYKNLIVYQKEGYYILLHHNSGVVSTIEIVADYDDSKLTPEDKVFDSIDISNCSLNYGTSSMDVISQKLDIPSLSSQVYKIKDLIFLVRQLEDRLQVLTIKENVLLELRETSEFTIPDGSIALKGTPYEGGLYLLDLSRALFILTDPKIVSLYLAE